MIWGIQWDLACDFISKKGEQKSITNSTTWGNYSDSIGDAAIMDGKTKKYGIKQVTGYSEYWKANNIYDLAGNCVEGSQEGIGTSARVSRGGLCNSSGASAPAAVRSTFSLFGYSSSFDATRPVLIIK